MNVLGCTINANPCPEAYQVWIDISSTVDYALLGITPASIFKALGFGMGFILLCWTIGFAADAVMKMVRKAQWSAQSH